MVQPDNFPPLPSKSLTKLESAWIDYTYSFIEECAVGYIKETRNQQADLYEVAEFLSCYIRNNKPHGLVSVFLVWAKWPELQLIVIKFVTRTICWTESTVTR